MFGNCTKCHRFGYMKTFPPPVILLLLCFLLGGCYSQLRLSAMEQDHRAERGRQDRVEPAGRADSPPEKGLAAGIPDAGNTGFAPADAYDMSLYPYSYNTPSYSVPPYAGNSSSGNLSFNTLYWVCWDPWDDLRYYGPGFGDDRYPSIAVFFDTGGRLKRSGVSPGRYGRRTIGTGRVTAGREPVPSPGNGTVSGERMRLQHSDVPTTKITTGVLSRPGSGNRLRSRTSTGPSSPRNRSRGN